MNCFWCTKEPVYGVLVMQGAFARTLCEVHKDAFQSVVGGVKYEPIALADNPKLRRLLEEQEQAKAAWVAASIAATDYMLGVSMPVIVVENTEKEK